MIKTLLIANRGEIAVRIIRSARDLGMRTVAIYSDADEEALHVELADTAVRVGPSPATASYLNTDAILAAAVEKSADAIHPGYGFLSENAGFAASVQELGMTWVGPSPESIIDMGDKIRARSLMEAAGVPVARGTAEPIGSLEHAVLAGEQVGYPLMVKAASGGGGIGMTVVETPEKLEAAFTTAQARAERFFGDSSILLEQLIKPARHVEVQILGLADGTIVTLGDRDCSLQRRHQKVIEESPSPGVTSSTRDRMAKAASDAGLAIGYRGAGTVEFLVNPLTQEFVFLEMNTRLQVEHPITELTHNVDLVDAQLRIAVGEDVAFDVGAVRSSGHAVEMRLYAEDPRTFYPSPGTIEKWSLPEREGLRVDSGYREGDVVSPHYDPLLAKLCVHAPTRQEAIEQASEVMREVSVAGIKTNASVLSRALESSEVRSGDYGTHSLEEQLR